MGVIGLDIEKLKAEHAQNLEAKAEKDRAERAQEIVLAWIKASPMATDEELQSFHDRATEISFWHWETP